MTARGNDPHLLGAQNAVANFKLGSLSADITLTTIWTAMKAAATQGYSTDPYVKLTDEVTFPGEVREVDPVKEQAAAEWMAELATREPEND